MLGLCQCDDMTIIFFIQILAFGLAAGAIEKVCCLEELSSTALVNQSGTCQQTIDKFIFKILISLQFQFVTDLTAMLVE